MVTIVFVEPEIPPNTGNAMRLAANTGSELHLIEPLGFELTDARVRRAGMDYRERASVRVFGGVEEWMSATSPSRVFAFSKSGSMAFTEVAYEDGDALMFGRESVGLDAGILESDWVTEVVHIPMVPGVRSLNLSNAAAIGVFEAWRQLGFPGAEQR